MQGIRTRAVEFLRSSPRFWPLLVIALAALIAMGSWWQDQELLWGIDANLPLRIDDIDRYFRITDAALGAPDARKLPFALPVGAILWLWGWLGIPYDPAVLQRVLFFVLLFAAGGSMYGLIRVSLTRLGRMAALGGGLFYMFNLYALTTIWTPLSNLLFHYSLLPLVFTLWLIAFKRQSVGFSILAAIAWSLTLTPAYTTTPVVVTDFLLLCGVALFYVVRASDRDERRRVALLGAVMTLTWIALNSYWIIPTFLYYGVESARGLAIGSPAELAALNSPSLERAIRIGGYWGLISGYKGSPYFPWSSYYQGPASLVGLLLPLMAVVGLMQRAGRPKLEFCPGCGAEVSRSGRWGTHSACQRCGQTVLIRRRLEQTTASLRFFAVLLLISLVLVTGPNEPLGQVKAWAMRDLSLFAPFRSVYQRFMVYSTLAYAPLIAGGLYMIGKAVRDRTWARVGRPLEVVAIGALVLVLAVGLALPMWNGAAFDRSGVIPSRRITIPSEYERVAGWLDAQEGDFLVLSYPYGPTSVTALRWDQGREGYLGMEPLELLSNKPLVLGDPSTSYLTSLVEQGSTGTDRAWPAFRLLNVRYVVVHLDANVEYLAGLPNWVGIDVGAVDESMSEAPGLSLRKSDGSLRVYEVNRWRPFRLFAVSGYDGSSIYELNLGDVRPVRYKKLGTATYRVEAEEIGSGEMLILNHPYDSSWRANERPPELVKPGLTGFRVASGTEVLIQHSLENRFPLLLVLGPSALFLLVVIPLALRLRRRRHVGGG